MSEKQIFRLVSGPARQNAMRAISYAADGMMVEIKPATRSLDQNAMLHAVFTEVSKKASFHGRRLTMSQWKTLFISGHAEATGVRTDVVPGLEGEFVNIRESSATMSVSRMSSLLEYVLAWCAMNGVRVEARAGAGYEEMA